MFPRMFSYGGILALAGAVTLATPGSGWAQRGGGHGGGGRGGGARVGGARMGGFGGARIGGARFGGARVGAFRGGANRFGGFRGGAYRGGYGYGYPGTYGYGYGYYGDLPYSYDFYPYAWSGAGYDSGYTGLYAGDWPSYTDGSPSFTPATAAYQASYPPATNATSPNLPAELNVAVPANAEVWFEGEPTTSTGLRRQFESPPLTPGTEYTYDVRARWKENGRDVTQTQKVKVTAGAHVNVNFPVSPKATGEASAVEKR